MKNAPLKILLVEDSPSDAELLTETLHNPGVGAFEVTRVESLGDGLTRLRNENFDLVLLDLSLPDSTGRDTIVRTRTAAPRLPIVILTGTPDDPFGVDCVRFGVQDYLVKGEFDARHIGRAIRYAIERKQLDLEMRELNTALERRVEERTAELKRVNLALREEIARSRELEGEVLNVSEREQRRIGRDLHDSLGQITTAMAMMSEGLEQDLLKGSLPKEAAVARRLTKLSRAVEEEARRLAHGLNPVAQNADGLMIALQGLAQFARHCFRVRCRFLCPAPVLLPDIPAAHHLFRIAQEAVNNAARHARPKSIQIKLWRDKTGLGLSIDDDGCGLPTDALAGRGMGLKLMRHRANLIGAAIRFEPSRPHGTRLVCSLPDRRPEQAARATPVREDTRRPATLATS